MYGGGDNDGRPMMGHGHGHGHGHAQEEEDGDEYGTMGIGEQMSGYASGVGGSGGAQQGQGRRGQDMARPSNMAQLPSTNVASNVRKYRMESDIFGTGFGPSQQESNPRYGMSIPDRALAGQEPKMRVSEMDVPAGMPTALQTVRSPTSGMPIDREMMEQDFDDSRGMNRRTSREAGGNPLTGEGYCDDPRVHTQRRQFHGSKSTPLW